MPDDARSISGYLDGSSIQERSIEEALSGARAEQSLLGALLSNSGLIRHLPESFSPAHYSDPWHGELHRAIAEIAAPGVPVAIPVLEAMGVSDQEKRAYVASLIAGAVSFHPLSIPVYANTVTDMHRRRGLHRTGVSMQEAALSGGEACTGAIASAMSQLDLLVAAGDVGGGSVTLDSAMDDALAAADRKASGEVESLSTGFRNIDEVAGSLDAGTMFVLAARPGMGKTALGLQIALNAALRGEAVLIISLEMSAAQLARRALCAFSGVPLKALTQGRHGFYADRLIGARRKLHGLKLTIEDGAGMTAGMIALKARAAKRKHGGLGLIMVDHLHIVRPDDADAKHGATWAVGRISGAMKRLAKDNGCPALVLAQLNRGVEGRDDKRPNLSDLRHAGDIEQDADAVAFLYRAEYYLGGEPEQGPGETREKHANRLSKWQDDQERLRGRAELIFAKVRDGEPGTVGLNFHAETTSFSEAVP